jgi:hypothetical protein
MTRCMDCDRAASREATRRFKKSHPPSHWQRCETCRVMLPIASFRIRKVVCATCEGKAEAQALMFKHGLLKLWRLPAHGESRDDKMDRLRSNGALVDAYVTSNPGCVW